MHFVAADTLVRSQKSSSAHSASVCGTANQPVRFPGLTRTATTFWEPLAASSPWPKLSSRLCGPSTLSPSLSCAWRLIRRREPSPIALRTASLGARGKVTCRRTLESDLKHVVVVDEHGHSRRGPLRRHETTLALMPSVGTAMSNSRACGIVRNYSNECVQCTPSCVGSGVLETSPACVAWVDCRPAISCTALSKAMLTNKIQLLIT